MISEILKLNGLPSYISNLASIGDNEGVGERQRRREAEDRHADLRRPDRHAG